MAAQEAPLNDAKTWSKLNCQSRTFLEQYPKRSKRPHDLRKAQLGVQDHRPHCLLPHQSFTRGFYILTSKQTLQISKWGFDHCTKPVVSCFTKRMALVVKFVAGKRFLGKSNGDSQDVQLLLVNFKLLRCTFAMLSETSTLHRCFSEVFLKARKEPHSTPLKYRYTARTSPSL